MIKQQPDMVGLCESHYRLLCHELVNGEEIKIVPHIFEALTEYITPHLPILPALTCMLSALWRKDFGIFRDYSLVWLPFCIVGSDCVRYRTAGMKKLHKAVSSVQMSDLTTNLLRLTLQSHGFDITFLYGSGIIIGDAENIRAFGGSFEHVRREKMRSALDTAGYPIKEVGRIEDISVLTIDLSPKGAEQRLLEDIERIITLLKDAKKSTYGRIECDLAVLLGAVHPTMKV